jgi:hypothetical protein
VPSCGHFELVQDQKERKKERKNQLVEAITALCELLLQLLRSREEFANEKS